jgi:3-deoxy-D-manno-octulosonic-acid transferase
LKAVFRLLCYPIRPDARIPIAFDMQFLYSVLLWLIFPFLIAGFSVRALLRPPYRAHWRERFGFYAGSKLPNSLQTVWIHAVSVGETRAAQPLIHKLLQELPSAQVVLTHMTPTGRAAGEMLYEKLIVQGRVHQAYLPYDYRSWQGRFLKHFKPSLGIVMETEIWPNLLFAATAAGVSTALVNARLSEKSLIKGLRIKSLMSRAVQQFSCIVAQSDKDAERILAFSPKVTPVVAASLKFDVAVPTQQILLGSQWVADLSRPVILLASSRDGEEAQFFSQAQKYRGKALFVVVPRHPERFDAVAAMAASAGFTVMRRSQGMLPETLARVDVLVGDSMGELFAYYKAASIGIMGGSFGPYGSQNLLEAMATACPIIIGPSRFNFDHIVQEALASGGAIGVPTMQDALEQAFKLLNNPTARLEVGASGRAFCTQHQGATHKTWLAIQGLL